MKLLINWFVSALALFIVSRLVPGFHLDGFGAALIASILIGLVNALIKPLLLLLTLPINVLTLGLFTLVINALLLLLASSFSPGFTIDNFATAFVSSILLSLVSTILHIIF